MNKLNDPPKSAPIPSNITIGNEANADVGQSLRRKAISRRQLVRTYEVLRANEAWFDAKYRAKQLVDATIMNRDSLYINVISNTILLVAILEVIAIELPAYIVWAFIGYALYVLIRRTDSRRIFSAALFALLLIPVVSLLNRQTLANNFASMTFYFLFIGIIRSILEIHQETKSSVKKSKLNKTAKIKL